MNADTACCLSHLGADPELHPALSSLPEDLLVLQVGVLPLAVVLVGEGHHVGLVALLACKWVGGMAGCIWGVAGWRRGCGEGVGGWGKAPHMSNTNVSVCPQKHSERVWHCGAVCGCEKGGWWKAGKAEPANAAICGDSECGGG